MNEWTIEISVEDVNTGEVTVFPPSIHRMSDAVLIAMCTGGASHRIAGRTVYMGRPLIDFTERKLTFRGEVT